MNLLVLLIIFGLVIACLTNQSSNQNPPRKPGPSPKKRQVILRKNGQQKKYRINQYGEVFEE